MAVFSEPERLKDGHDAAARLLQAIPVPRLDPASRARMLARLRGSRPARSLAPVVLASLAVGAALALLRKRRPALRG